MSYRYFIKLKNGIWIETTFRGYVRYTGKKKRCLFDITDELNKKQ